MPSRIRLALLLISANLKGQPAISQNGVVNQASQIPPTLPGGALARGALITIRGVHFRDSAKVSLLNGALKTPVRPLSIGPERIEALIPAAAPIGPGSLVVAAGGLESPPFPVEITVSNPGIFSRNALGWGAGWIENIDSRGRRAPNSISNPAHRGQQIAMRITGLGVGPSTLIVGNRTVHVGAPIVLGTGKGQEVLFRIPADAPEGCNVPVYFRPKESKASNVVTMTIRSGPGECDPGPVPQLDRQRVGIVVLTRADILRKGVSTVSDELLAQFSAKSGPAISPLMLVPPPGTCTAYSGSLQSATVMPDSISNAIIAGLEGDGLTVGTQLVVSRADQRRTVAAARGAAGYFRGRLGSSRPGNRGLPLFLEPGDLILSSAGGIDVGPFRVSIKSPPSLEWTNRDQIDKIDRSSGVELRWREQARDQTIVILATNVDRITTAIGTCFCTAPANATRFEIPPAILANIPKSDDSPGVPYDQIFVASIPSKPAAAIEAKGLDQGAILTIFASGRYVQYY